MRRGRGVLDINHGRSRMTTEPRITTMPGRSTSDFTDKAGIACTKRKAKREVFDEPYEGWTASY